MGCVTEQQKRKNTRAPLFIHSIFSYPSVYICICAECIVALLPLPTERHYPIYSRSKGRECSVSSSLHRNHHRNIIAFCFAEHQRNADCYQRAHSGARRAAAKDLTHNQNTTHTKMHYKYCMYIVCID